MRVSNIWRTGHPISSPAPCSASLLATRWSNSMKRIAACPSPWHRHRTAPWSFAIGRCSSLFRRELVLGHFELRQREIEAGTRTGQRFHPDLAAMTFDDLLADRETKSRAGILLARVQTFEQHEDALEMFRRDTDTVVAHREAPIVAVRLHLDAHHRRLWPLEFECIADEVLEHLPKLRAVGH